MDKHKRTRRAAASQVQVKQLSAAEEAKLQAALAEKLHQALQIERMLSWKRRPLRKRLLVLGADLV